MEERITTLFHEGKIKKNNDYILYWVQSSLFFDDNFTLAYALQQAKKYKKKIRCIFLLQKQFPNANTRNMDFLLQGLFAYQKGLADIGLFLEIIFADDKKVVEIFDAAVSIVTDEAHHFFQRKKIEARAKSTQVQLSVLENNLVIPVQQAYPKMAYNARILRKPLTTKVLAFFEEEKQRITASYLREQLLHYQIESFKSGTLLEKEQQEILYQEVMQQLIKIAKVTQRKGGYEAARESWDLFFEQLASYGTAKKINVLEQQSMMGAYLHFGQMSPVTLVRRLLYAEPTVGGNNFFEQLVIRRELSFNYEYYSNEAKLSFNYLPLWAKKTFIDHQDDGRQHTYTYEQLAAAKTHDNIWNAAQKQLLKEGYMHNYLRMYWGKKVIEWTPTYEDALQILQELNDTYQLDGRDANGNAGILWCFGLHDRAWQERPIFGKLRYMNAAGVRRKTNIDEYIAYYTCKI